MRCLVLVKATPDSEAGTRPGQALMTAMAAFHAALVAAGVLLAGEGLHPSAKGARVRCCGRQRTVAEGPFPDTRALVAGFWLWDVRSLDEAIEWALRCPLPDDSEIEIRPVLEAADGGAALTPGLPAQPARLGQPLATRG